MSPRALSLGAFLSALLVSAAGAQVAPPVGEDARWVLAARLAADSLLGGPGTPGEVLIAQDSATARLLRSAGAAVARVERAPLVACPRSTDQTGAPVAEETGYVVTIEVHPTEDPARQVVATTLSCRFVFRGRSQGFASGHTWEIRREGEEWRVVRLLGSWIT